MLIKQQLLTQHLEKNTYPIYLLIGQEHFLLNQSLSTLKEFLKKSNESEERKYSIQSPDEWQNIIEEAKSYSLFSEQVVLDIYFDKKTIDSEGKKILTEYLKSINSRCSIIIQGPNLQAKQLQWLSNNNQVLVVQSYPLDTESMIK